MTTAAALPRWPPTARRLAVRRRRYTCGRRGRRLAVRGGGALAVGVSAAVLLSSDSSSADERYDSSNIWTVFRLSYIGCIWTPASVSRTPVPSPSGWAPPIRLQRLAPIATLRSTPAPVVQCSYVRHRPPGALTWSHTQCTCAADTWLVVLSSTPMASHSRQPVPHVLTLDLRFGDNGVNLSSTLTSTRPPMTSTTSPPPTDSRLRSTVCDIRGTRSAVGDPTVETFEANVWPHSVVTARRQICSHCRTLTVRATTGWPPGLRNGRTGSRP